MGIEIDSGVTITGGIIIGQFSAIPNEPIAEEDGVTLIITQDGNNIVEQQQI